MRFNTENSLKRFLKRKVKITLGFVVAFMITGTVVFAKAYNDTDAVYNDIIYGDGDVTITGGTFNNRILGGKSGDNKSIFSIDGTNNKVILNGAIYGGTIDSGVENIDFTIKNYTYKVVTSEQANNKIGIQGGSRAEKDKNIKDGDIVVNIENSDFYADLLGGTGIFGENATGETNSTVVNITNTSISGYQDDNNNTWTGRVFGAGRVQGGDFLKQNTSEVNINNVTGVTYNKDGETVENTIGARIYGGGQLFGKASSGKNSELKIDSTKVSINGENTELAEIYGGSIISGTGNKGIIETGKTEITINNGKIVNYVAGGNNTNWNGYSVIGVEDENGQYEYNGKKYNAGSTNIIINGGDLSTAKIMGGSFTDYAWYYESKDNVVHDSIVFGTANIEINNGKIGTIIGGGGADYYNNEVPNTQIEVSPVNSKMIGNTNIIIKNGEIDTIIGGGYSTTNQDVESNANIEGNTNIAISGGTITGDVIGGGYTQGEKATAIVDGNSKILISGGEIKGRIIAGGETENAKVTGKAKVTIDVDNLQTKGIYSGYSGTSILELTENVGTFDTSLVMEENDSNGFNDFIVHGATELTGGLKNINLLHTVENANAIIVEDIVNENVNFNIENISKITLKTARNIINDIEGEGTLVIDAEVKDGTLKTNGGVQAENIASTIKIGTNVTSDDLIGKDIQKAIENLNNSVETKKKNNTIEITEGKLFGAITGKATNDGVSDIKTEIKSNTVIGIEDLATINYLSWKQEMSSLAQRMGELRNSSAENGIWARVYGGKVEHGSQYDNEYQTYQIGYDKKYHIDNGKIYLGYLISYTDGETNYSLGSGENYSVGAGMYAIWLNNNGHYIDILYKVSRLTNKFDVNGKDGNLNSVGEYDNWGISLSGEYGKRFEVTNKWFIEPSISLTVGRLGSETYTTSSEIKVSQDSIYTAEGKLGTAVGYNFSDKGNVYIKAALVREFAGDVDAKYQTNVAYLSSSEDLGDTWAEFGVGANYRVKENVNLYVDLEKTGDSTVDTKWQANLGFRWEF